jgi:hypothetical protein
MAMDFFDDGRDAVAGPNHPKTRVELFTPADVDGLQFIGQLASSGMMLSLRPFAVGQK